MWQTTKIELKFQFQILSMSYYFHTHNLIYAYQQILQETHVKTFVCGDKRNSEPCTSQAKLLMNMNNVLNIMWPECYMGHMLNTLFIRNSKMTKYPLFYYPGKCEWSGHIRIKLAGTTLPPRSCGRDSQSMINKSSLADSKGPNMQLLTITIIRAAITLALHWMLISYYCKLTILLCHGCQMPTCARLLLLHQDINSNILLCSPLQVTKYFNM